METQYGGSEVKCLTSGMCSRFLWRGGHCLFKSLTPAGFSSCSVVFSRHGRRSGLFSLPGPGFQHAAGKRATSPVRRSPAPRLLAAWHVLRRHVRMRWEKVTRGSGRRGQRSFCSFVCCTVWMWNVVCLVCLLNWSSAKVTASLWGGSDQRDCNPRAPSESLWMINLLIGSYGNKAESWFYWGK